MKKKRGSSGLMQTDQMFSEYVFYSMNIAYARQLKRGTLHTASWPLGLLAVLNLLKYDGMLPAKEYLYCFVVLINSFSDWLNYSGNFNQITAAV